MELISKLTAANSRLVERVQTLEAQFANLEASRSKSRSPRRANVRTMNDGPVFE